MRLGNIVLYGMIGVIALFAAVATMGLSAVDGEIGPQSRDYAGSPSRVFGDFGRADMPHIDRDDAQFGRAGGETVVRRSLPAGEFFREETDGRITVEARIDRGDYVIYRGILDDAGTTYTVRVDFDPIEGPEDRTRVTVSSEVAGPDRGDVVRMAGWRIFVAEFTERTFRRIERDLNG